MWLPIALRALDELEGDVDEREHHLDWEQPVEQVLYASVLNVCRLVMRGEGDQSIYLWGQGWGWVLRIFKFDIDIGPLNVGDLLDDHEAIDADHVNQGFVIDV